MPRPVQGNTPLQNSYLEVFMEWMRSELPTEREELLLQKEKALGWVLWEGGLIEEPWQVLGPPTRRVQRLRRHTPDSR